MCDPQRIKGITMIADNLLWAEELPEAMESEEGGGDEIEVVDFVRRAGSEPFREILGESKVWL